MFQTYRMEATDLDPRTYLVANDNWLEFTLRYVVDYKRRRRTKDLIFTRLLDEIDQTADRVSLASATFELVQAPEIKVTLNEPSPGA